jgi:hypothetical protein
MELGYAMEGMTDGWMGAEWSLHAPNPAVHVEAHPSGRSKRISARAKGDAYDFSGGCLVRLTPTPPTPTSTSRVSA